jgi:Fe-S cluster biogenesis protein NfuA
MREKVQQALEEMRPALLADGGDMELIDIVGGVVKIRLMGHCAGCPMSMWTLKNGIEMRLKELIPEVERVEAV